MSDNPLYGLSVMKRSQNQLATSYAPGSLFTFEGGQGCFLSVAKSAETWSANDLSAIRPQIEESLKEFIEVWYQRALTINDNEGSPQIYPEQILDETFLDHNGQPDFNRTSYILFKPSEVGYVPDPLVFVCEHCNDLRKIDKFEYFETVFNKMKAETNCGGCDDQRHNWKQVDVVFAHWSGAYKGLYPSRNSCGNCGAEDSFKLTRKNTGSFNDWSFDCKSCPDKQEIVIPEKGTYDLLYDKRDDVHPNEYNMLPVSYRASSLFYPQSDSFIVYSDTSYIDWLSPNSSEGHKLIDHLMSEYNYTGSLPSLDEIVDGLTKNGEKDAADFIRVIRTTFNDEHEEIANYINRNKADWANAGKLQIADSIPVELQEVVNSRFEYVRKYDPVRQSLEHKQLVNEYLSTSISSSVGHARSTDLSSPDPDVHPFKFDDEKREYEKEAKVVFSKLGFDEVCLIRDLELCQYSFGFTRVSSTPVVDIKGIKVPVKLNAFNKIKGDDGQKTPIYVLKQKNEGFYFKLNEDLIKEWLITNNIATDEEFEDDVRLGAKYLESYRPFSRFLEEFKREDSPIDMNISSSIYTLIHTYAHQLIHVIAEFSGLDISSLGEYIFPADCAFIIYRKGMTTDLGNLSSTWRDHHLEIMRQLLETHRHLCNSGTLCDERGGACPGCIMVPDVTCIAQNQLLSRSVLSGGYYPHWSTNNKEIMTGFLELSTEK